MSFKINEEHKTFLRVFITYGIHLWLLIFVCNVVLFYSIRFFINASTTRTANVIQPTNQAVQDPSLPTDIPTPIPTAVGPIVDLAFSLPGIGTNGGNLIPSHPDRNANIYLYNSDSNTSDKGVMPVYSISTHAVYDDDPNSPTFTFFVNKYVDLGAVVDGRYQIAIQTPQGLRQLIKPLDGKGIRGELFDLSTRHLSILPPLVMITGDIYPSPNGDKVMDINDYNALVSCFNAQVNSPSCADAGLGDLDDNGVVDGIDYNIMLTNFRTLLRLGFPVPTLSVFPAPTKSEAIAVTPIEDISATSVPVPIKPSSSGSFGAIIIFILLVFILGILAFISYKFHLLKILFPKKSESQSTVETPPADETADQAVDQTDSKIPTGDTIEKSGFLKKVSFDAQTNGTWVTLADDSGTTRGFYPKDNVSDGFVKIKGTMKNDQDYKPYIFITEINAED